LPAGRASVARDEESMGLPVYGQLSGDEVAALPYSYTVDIHD
jgi:hypothetical protein